MFTAPNQSRVPTLTSLDFSISMCLKCRRGPLRLTKRSGDCPTQSHSQHAPFHATFPGCLLSPGTGAYAQHYHDIVLCSKENKHSEATEKVG